MSNVVIAIGILYEPEKKHKCTKKLYLFRKYAYFGNNVIILHDLRIVSRMITLLPKYVFTKYKYIFYEFVFFSYLLLTDKISIGNLHGRD